MATGEALMDDAFERLTKRLEESMRTEKADVILDIAAMLYGEQDEDVVAARAEMESD